MQELVLTEPGRPRCIAPWIGPVGRATEFFAIPARRSCCSAVNSWAARQRRPANDVKNSAPPPQPEDFRRNCLTFAWIQRVIATPMTHAPSRRVRDSP